MDIIKKLAEEFKIRNTQVESTVNLIDEGNTIPFIARYRKEVTGGLSDEVLRDMDERLTYLRGLEERKEEVIRLIDEQGQLTEELKTQITEAEVLQRVEDLYKPFKKKKATRASKAKEKGLEPLADIIWAQTETGSLTDIAGAFTDAATGSENGVETAEDAIQGACDIIAERISDDPEVNAAVRKKTEESGLITSEAADPEEKTVYEMYYEFGEKISKIPNHRVLAINRGEKEKKLKVKVTTDSETMEKLIADSLPGGTKVAEGTEFEAPLKATIADSYKRLIAPSIEREMRNMLTETAEAEAVKLFAKNTEKLLMVPPVKGARIIAIDPGYRTGCKVAVLDETGKLKAYTTVYPTEPKKEIAKTEATLKKIADKFNINTIVIGNGTASRETEEVVAGFIRKYAKANPKAQEIRYTIVNEAGASVYSASKLATEEYPDLDVTVRGAMSLGRRLQDPLAELVKIPTKSIGVGQYQHDINQKLLEGALDNVVEDCVNRVGVELNTASPSLLAHVAGINMGIARNIVAYREENGIFTDRKQLKKVPKLGEKAYGQCAGFIRIAEGKNPLDNTAVHPESYKAAETMLAKLGYDKNALTGEDAGFADIDDRIWDMYGEEEKPKLQGGRVKGFAALNEIAKAADDSRPKRNMKKAIEKLAADLDIGAPTLTDIIAEMKKPGRDPREDAPEVIFRNDVKSFEDLKIDMELEGTVRNVVDFGAFVDIGVKNDGLVHISQMSRKYIKHPMEVVSVGDTVKVRIIKIDYDKQKIGLSMI
ncbi:MAG: RNA-binding transcriptional accessory protein [Clostridia bacterium]|nr:RNA-binding transcriptional accessory protein [Clostridia bacterium]